MTGVNPNRIALFVSCVASLVIALGVDSIVGIVTVAADILAVAVFVPVIGALFMRRSGTAAAVASIVAGTVVCVIFMVISGLYANEPVLYGMLASFLAFVIVSAVTPKRPAVDFEDLPRPGALTADPEPEPEPEPAHAPIH